MDVSAYVRTWNTNSERRTQNPEQFQLLRLPVLVHLNCSDWSHADEYQDSGLFFTLPRSVPMHRVRLVDGDGTGRHRVGGLLVIDIAGRDPPGARDHIRVTLLIVKMRLREIAWIPLDDDAIEARLVGIAEQQPLLLPAFLAGPLDVFGQDGGNMGGIGRRAHRVVDGCLGALRMSDPGTSAGADSHGDGHT